MSDIFNEINDELRQEKIQQFWQDNKVFIIGSIIAAIIFTAGFNLWKDWRKNTYTEETTAFYTALNTTEIDNLVEYANVAKGDHIALSRLSAASIYLNKGELDKAIDMIQAIQTDRSIDKIYRDFAILLEAQYVLNDADNKTLNELEASLIPLTSPRNTWQLSAQETLALIAGRQENFVKAISIIDHLLLMPDIPSKMNNRVKQLKLLYLSQQPTVSSDELKSN